MRDETLIDLGDAVWQERGLVRRKSAAERALDVSVRMPGLTVKTLAAELAVCGRAPTEAARRLRESAVVS